MEEIIQAMVATQPDQPFEDYQSTWHEVRASLEDACIHAMPADERLLSRLVALLLYGEWQATALDLLTHPKLPGYCLVPAKVVKQPHECHWAYLLQYDCFGRRYVAARKVLCTLAWHFSRGDDRRREFLWCRRGAWLVQRLWKRWRHERRMR